MTKSVSWNARLLLIAALTGQMALPVFADASVRLGGVPVITVPAASGGMTPDQRAKAMQKNIDNALVATSNKSPSAVGVSIVSGQPVVTLGGFYVCTVDAASAKVAKMTPSALANRWAGQLKSAMQNQSAVDAYVAQLTGSTTIAQAGTTTTATGTYPFYRQGRIVYIPAGMTMSVTLNTAVSSSTAKPGDPVQAVLAEDVNLGDSNIPANSILIGKVTEAIAGQRMGKSGTLGLKFTKLRTPDGVETPLTAHIIGGLDKFDAQGTNSDVYKGETTATKVKQAAIHGAVGAGAGALLGTTIGAIASHGYGTGRGALAGTAIGATLGVAESFLYRKGADVQVESGKVLKLQLDAPASIGMSAANL